MHLLTLEESGLWEIPVGSIDSFDGRPVEHGPWQVIDCSRTLLVFLRGGLLGTYEMQWAKPETSREHDADESAALLACTDEWTIERGGYLVPTDLGMATPWQGWFALAPRSSG